MRIISFCCDGIKEAAAQGFFEWLGQQDADFICLQNIKTAEYELRDPVFFPEGYNAYFFDAAEKNTNGVAIYCKAMPKAIMTGLGFTDFDMEGRYIQADFEGFSVGSLLVPPGSLTDNTQQQRKLQFLDQFNGHMDKVRNKRRDFFICGNFNTAHRDIDVQNIAQQSQQTGFLKPERELLDQLFNELTYIDAFRASSTDRDEFTCWPEGENKDAWRIDYQVVSPGLKDVVEYGVIYKNQIFSSHRPVIMDYEYDIEIE